MLPNSVDQQTTTTILKSFLVKSNILIDLNAVVDILPIATSDRSGSIIALKYQNSIKGREDLFKNKTSFKNACHLIIWHTMEKQVAQVTMPKQVKKLVKVKMTSSGTFQVVGVPEAEVERIVYKIFSIMETVNKNSTVKVFQYLKPTIGSPDFLRFELLVVPILCNYMVTLTENTVGKFFGFGNRLAAVQHFVDNGYLSFVVPNDCAITIKMPISYDRFKEHPVRYVTWSKKNGKLARYVQYQSYTTVLRAGQQQNAKCKKYMTLRLYSTGKIFISCFMESIFLEEVQKFFKVCRSQSVPTSAKCADKRAWETSQ